MKNMAARLQSLEVIEQVSSASFIDPLLLQDSEEVAFHQAFFHHEAMVLSCLIYQSFFRQTGGQIPLSAPLR